MIMKKIFIILVQTVLSIKSLVYALDPDCYELENPRNENSSTKNIFIESCASGVCAAVSLVPPYKYFIQKSQLQKGIHTNVLFLEALRLGFYSMPNTAATLTVQLYSEEKIKELIQHYFQVKNPVAISICGSLFGALCASPLYDIMNRQMQGEHSALAVKGFLRNSYNFRYIVGREFFFLGSLQASSPLSAEVKKYFGENMFTKNISYFISGALGSIAGHPFDTILTRQQSGLPLKLEFLFIGCKSKAIGIGCFAVLFKNLQDIKSRCCLKKPDKNI